MKISGLPCACILWLCTQNALVGQNWAYRGFGPLEVLNGVCYGNGLFVAVGTGYAILTSTDGSNWTAVSSIPPHYYVLTSVAYGGGVFVAGGSYKGELITTSTDGYHWTNGVSTIGPEGVYGITYGYGRFVAVGFDGNWHSSYVLTSSNAVDWTIRDYPVMPGSNALFGVTAGIGADGHSSPSPIFVAVGDHGTIMTSTNGVRWTSRSSGTTAALRTVAFHGGKFVAGGDSGVVLSSADGVVWAAAAPTSFNVRGFASSGTNLLAVGDYFGHGRLQLSPDGLNWAGKSTAATTMLNATVFSSQGFVAVGNAEIVQSIPGSSPVLSFSRTSSQLTLSWIGDYVLMSATDAGGPYLAVAGASSPFTIPAVGPQTFFRLATTAQ